MKFSCERDILVDALTIAARAVSSHANIDVLKGILIDTGDGYISVIGNDMEIAMQSTVEADVSEHGVCVLDAKMILDIVRKLPSERIFFEVDSHYQTVITCLLSEFTIMALPADKYPSIPEVSGLKQLEISQKVLKKQLEHTVFAVSDNEAKMVHTGALFDVENNKLTIVALDGHRLALSREDVETDEECYFVVPAVTLRELIRILSDEEDAKIKLHVGSRHILFELANMTVVTRLLDGEFLKYKSTIPKTGTIKATVNVRAMIQSVERVSLLISEKLKNPIKLILSENTINISCITAMGRAIDECPCVCEGELEVGFNNRYVLDALRHVPDDEIEIVSAGPLAPCVLKPVGSTDILQDSYLFMVLPVRLRAE